MVWSEHSIHSVLPYFCSTTHSFQVFDVPNDIIRGWVLSVTLMFLQLFTWIAVLIILSVLLQHYLVGSLSSLHTSMLVRLCRFWDCPSTGYKEFGLIPPKDNIIVRYCEYDHLLFICLPPILTTLIICRVVLLLILIILFRHCVNFLLLWSVYSFLAFYLWFWVMSVSLNVIRVGRWNSYFERNPNFLL